MTSSSKQFFAYVRVSTLKQGTQGSSLQEQRGAIEAYAQRNGISIVEWFEERVTAAKRGRSVFARMLKALERGRAHGIIIHKIDRSARNLRDWADLADLIDRGAEIHFEGGLGDISAEMLAQS
jgi:DNA invertase Pin-like site-specific DNA recombinase